MARSLAGDQTLSLRQMALAGVRYIGDPPVLYWTAGLMLFLILVLVSVAPLWLEADASAKERRRISRFLVDRRFYGLMVNLTVAGLRWPVLSLDLLNSDESHSIACAMKLAVDPVFWRGIDGTTGGPLLYYPLLLPRLFGLPIEYGSARAVGLVALTASVLLVYGTFRRLFDEGVARVAVLPLVTAWALATAKPFTHYSSEQIPVFLVTLGLYFLVRWWKAPSGSNWTLFLCGLALGALPFAKLQAVPIGLFVAACGVALIARRHRQSVGEAVKRLALFTASGFVVSAVFVLMVVGTGTWRDFWQSYIVNNLGYGNRYLLPDVIGSSLSERVWVVVDRSFWTYDLSELSGATLVVGVLGLLAAVFLDRHALWKRSGLLLAAAGGVLISTAAIAYPGTMFSHYFLFLAVPLTLFMGAWLGLAVEIGRNRSPTRWERAIVAVVVISFVALTVARPLNRRLGRDHPVFARAGEIPEVLSSPVAEAALAFARQGESMAVWGWEPWRYVETGLFPATRDTQTQWQILDTPQRPYYLKRLRQDLMDAAPPVFVDSVGFVDDPRFPGRRPLFWDRETQAHDVFPEIAEVVSRHYRQVSEVDTSRIYVSRSRLAQLESSTGADLSSLSATDLLEAVPRLSQVDVEATKN